MPAPSGGVTRPRTPRTAVLPRPLQYCQVPAPSGGVTRRLVPRARRILLPRPLQHLQVPALCGLCTRARAPRAGRSVLPPRPLQHFQVPALASHGHPFAFAQANFATDPTNELSFSRTTPSLPASGKPRDTTAASHVFPTRESRAQSVGLSRSSTSEMRSGHSSHGLADIARHVRGCHSIPEMRVQMPYGYDARTPPCRRTNRTGYEVDAGMTSEATVSSSESLQLTCLHTFGKQKKKWQ